MIIFFCTVIIIILISAVRINLIIYMDKSAENSDDDYYGFKLKLKILFVSILLIPEKSKKHKRRKKKPGKTKVKQEVDAGKIISTAKKINELMSGSLGHVLKALSINDFKLDIIVSADDSMQTALLYGGVCAAVYNTWALIENNIKVKKRHINISPDFLGNKTKINQLTGRISTSVSKVVVAVIKILFIIIKNTNKKDEIKSKRGDTINGTPN